jgi:acetoin utilization protein AcuB
VAGEIEEKREMLVRDRMKVLLEMLGAREETVRLAMLVPDQKGTLAQVASRITELGGDILALGTIANGDSTKRQLTVRVTDVSLEQLISAMEDMALEMLDARYCTTPACAI